MSRTDYDSTVVLTGFPSFVSRRMAEQILRCEKNTRLYCVVKNKLTLAAEKFALTLPVSQRERLVMLSGDAAALDMGLSGAEFREISASIDRIFHFAQVSHIDADPKLARLVNVQGAREALEMARAAPKLRNLIHLSSASVSATRTGLVKESDGPSPPPYRTVVEESLARAERIVRRATHKVPLTILRPSIIIGDSKTGDIDRFDGPYPLILLILTSPAKMDTPLPIVGNLPLNLVPVDFVVRASHTISLASRGLGRTYHLVDPSPLSARRVFELVARAAGRRSPRGFVPSYVARSMIHAPGIERFVKGPRAFFKLLTTDVRYEARNADEALRQARIVCPPFESYVDNIVAYVKTRLREQQQRSDDEQQNLDDPLS